MTHMLHFTDNYLLMYIIPIVQRECDIFVKYRDCHRIRGQDKLEIPAGVPHFFFPGAVWGYQYGDSIKQRSIKRGCRGIR